MKVSEQIKILSQLLIVAENARRAGRQDVMNLTLMRMKQILIDRYSLAFHTLN